MAWLQRDGVVLASAEVARSRRDRRRGLRGRESLDGVLVLQPCRQIHTFGVRFPIDVAFCDADGQVRHVATLGPRRLSRWVPSARFAVEAPAGALGRWEVRVGDVLQIMSEQASP